MKTRRNAVKISSAALLMLAVVLTSCEDEPARITLQDTADLTEEAITDAYFQDLDDMAGVAIETPSDPQFSGGRSAGSLTIEDQRFNCAGITITLEGGTDPDNPDVPQGVLTVDFGATGCIDQKGNVRTGKLIFTYHGKRFMPGSTVITTTDNYTINGVKLEGTRTLTNAQTSTESAPRFNVVLADGKATFADGMSATRESNITWQWHRAANRADDSIEIETTSTASGVRRSGRSYAVSILENLIYKRHCGIAVSGVKQYVINAKREITIDYGDGTCDKEFTMTINGATRQVSL